MNKGYRALARPYEIFMALFIGIPLILMVVIAFSSVKNYSDLVNFRFSLSFTHIADVFTGSQYLRAFGKSMALAAIASLGCLLIGYFVAYFITRLHLKHKFILLILFLLPMWTNMLCRVGVINTLLKENGFMKNVFGISLGLSGTDAAVVIVMILIYLPFMIFPVYTVLEKLDPALIEASLDLGASPLKTFFKVTVPLSLKGVSSGLIMTFLPCAMGYAIPSIVSNGKLYLIGNKIEALFTGSAQQYNLGSFISLVIMVLIIGLLLIVAKSDPEGETLI